MMKRLTCLLMALILILGLSFSLVSCGKEEEEETEEMIFPNTDPEAAMVSLEEAGYTVSSIVGDELLNSPYEGMTAVVGANRDDLSVFVYYFDTSENANNAYLRMKEIFDGEKDQTGDGSEYVIGKHENIVYIGNEEAIKAAQ